MISAATLSLYDICKKHSASENRSFTVLFYTTLSSLAAVTLVLASRGELISSLALKPAHIALLVLKSLIVSASWACAYWALKTIPVTVMAPIRATGPMWTTLAAMAIFSEVPTVRQAFGFLLAFGGCIAFSVATRIEGFSLKSRPILLALGATAFGSLSALYDKCLLNSLAIPAKAVLLWFMMAMCLIYAIAMFSCAKVDKTKFEWRWTIPLVGILLAASDFCYFSALGDPEARISIISTIRRTSTVGTFILGGAMFREKNLLRKGLALAAILAGVLLIL